MQSACFFVRLIATIYQFLKVLVKMHLPVGIMYLARKTEDDSSWFGYLSNCILPCKQEWSFRMWKNVTIPCLLLKTENCSENR